MKMLRHSYDNEAQVQSQNACGEKKASTFYVLRESYFSFFLVLISVHSHIQKKKKLDSKALLTRPSIDASSVTVHGSR